MHIRLPASRARLGLRFSPMDVALAAIAPIAALSLRNVDILSNHHLNTALVYWAVSAPCSLVAFGAFGIGLGIPGFLSVHDVLDLANSRCRWRLDNIRRNLFLATRLREFAYGSGNSRVDSRGSLFAVRVAAHVIARSMRRRRNGGYAGEYL